MKKNETQMTATEAVELLRSLYNKSKASAKGGPSLTLQMIMQETKVKTIATVSLWISEGKRHHEPKGAGLENLSRFLEKAKDKTWLEKLIAKKGRK